ncbi:hypothetical protein LTR36_005657 [Oleoguttula mirabilis]|uniref:RING-type domain-containing protein n=1 Tax=Oleoguttula mirabilis TaxID=1507867 RepID=A0AAV9JDE2_9PEZI|nr:hypothetical protein LTR36_005657 [Oleoguttula mirabilis]
MAIMDAELPLSYKEAHHLTSLWYPAIHLLTPDVEIPFLHPPLHDDRMHAPTDLIPNARVAENTRRDNAPETSFFTIDRADAGNLNRRPVVLAAQFPPLMRLIHDTRVHQYSVGHTTIDFVTFFGPDGKQMVRAVRRSIVRSAGGQRSGSSGSYDLPLADLLRGARFSDAPPFVITMVVFVDRLNARAIRHVSYQLQIQDIDEGDLDDEYDFKPAREIDYVDSLRALLTPVKVQELDLEDRDCSICHVAYDATTSGHCENPVALPCGHVVGEICIFKWYAGGEVRSPTGVKCPLCRQCPFSATDTRALEFGLTNGVYLEDPRYSEYENFERSCGDIDDTAYNYDDETEFTPQLAVIKQAMHLLLDGAKLEDELSTPYHLQAARSQEMRTIMREVDHEITVQAQVRPAAISEFVAAFGGVFRHLLLEEMTTSEMAPFFVSSESALDLPGLRPGLEAFMHRLLSRAARFQRLRPCNCSSGFHKHGVRTYYNAREAYE